MDWKRLYGELDERCSWNDTVFLEIYNKDSDGYKVYDLSRVELDIRNGHILLIGEVENNDFISNDAKE